MKLLTTKTQFEIDLLNKETSVLRGIEAIHNTVTVLKEENEKIRSLPKDRLLAILNDDIEITSSILEVNTSIGIILNSFLDQVGLSQFSNRIITNSNIQGITFNGTNYEDEEPLTPNP